MKSLKTLLPSRGSMERLAEVVVVAQYHVSWVPHDQHPNVHKEVPMTLYAYSFTFFKKIYVYICK